jgi:hypothetical protein
MVPGLREPPTAERLRSRAATVALNPRRTQLREATFPVLSRRGRAAHVRRVVRARRKGWHEAPGTRSAQSMATPNRQICA